MKTPLIPGVHSDIQSLIKLRLDARLLKLDLTKGVRSTLAGQYHSRFRGRGMDYAESRQYHPGDDVRNIDWRVTARTGTVHTKIYIEERERPVFIMVDFSPSLYFGTRKTFKSVLAAEAASMIAWTAIQNGDRVGGIFLAAGKITNLKPKSGRMGALSIIDALSQATRAEPGNNEEDTLDTALQHLNAVVHPGSLVFVFSDFYSVSEQSKKYLSLIREHNDIVICSLRDPIEINPPAAGRYFIAGRTDEEIAVIDTSGKQIREKYSAFFEDRQKNLDEIARSLKAPVLNLVNGENILDPLLGMFRK